MVIELIKPAYGNPIDAQTHTEVIEIFENNCDYSTLYAIFKRGALARYRMPK